MKNFKKVITVILVTVLLLLLVGAIIQQKNEVLKLQWRFKLSDVLLLFAFAIPMQLLNVLGWHVILKFLNTKIPFSSSLRIWSLSNLARFIPGSIWQYGGRIFLATEENIPAQVVVWSLLVEAVVNLSVGMLIVLTWMIVGGYNVFNSQLKIAIILGFVILGVFLASFKIIIKFVKSFLEKRFKQKLELVSFNKAWILPILLIYITEFILGGIILFVLSRGLVTITLNNYWYFVCVFTLSWMLGYITFFIPGGLGVQEISVAGFLTRFMSLASAVIVAIALRALLLCSELLVILITIILIGKNTIRRN